MASRRSLAAFHSIMLSYTRVLQGWWYIVYVALVSAVSRWDTYPSETHCKLRRSAAVGISSAHPLLVPRRGTDYRPQHHTGYVSPPSGNYI